MRGSGRSSPFVSRLRSERRSKQRPSRTGRRRQTGRGLSCLRRASVPSPCARKMGSRQGRGIRRSGRRPRSRQLDEQRRGPRLRSRIHGQPSAGRSSRELASPWPSSRSCRTEYEEHGARSSRTLVPQASACRVARRASGATCASSGRPFAWATGYPVPSATGPANPKPTTTAVTCFSSSARKLMPSASSASPGSKNVVTW